MEMTDTYSRRRRKLVQTAEVPPNGRLDALEFNSFVFTHYFLLQ